MNPPILSTPLGGGDLHKDTNGNWHTPDEKFLKVITDTLNNWHVWDQSGTEYLLAPLTNYAWVGIVQDRADFGGPTFGDCYSEPPQTYPNGWYVTAITDTHGNTARVNYSVETGGLKYRCDDRSLITFSYAQAVYPVSITVNSAAAQVTFDYVTKPEASA